jgi:hypothetical protein
MAARPAVRVHAMGRGSRAKVRWTKDRARRKRLRDKRKAEEKGAARKKAA